SLEEPDAPIEVAEKTTTVTPDQKTVVEKNTKITPASKETVAEKEQEKEIKKEPTPEPEEPMDEFARLKAKLDKAVYASERIHQSHVAEAEKPAATEETVVT